MGSESRLADKLERCGLSMSGPAPRPAGLLGTLAPLASEDERCRRIEERASAAMAAAAMATPALPPALRPVTADDEKAARVADRCIDLGASLPGSNASGFFF